MQNISHLIRSRLFIFIFIFITLRGGLKKILLWFIDQQNRTENPEINLRTNGHSIYEKRRQKYTVEKRQSLQYVVLGKLDSYV